MVEIKLVSESFVSSASEELKIYCLLSPLPRGKELEMGQGPNRPQFKLV
jgi:hypothetical protein